VTVAGLVIIRQRPGTANGVIFMTLEDETDIANAIVWPKMFERFRGRSSSAPVSSPSPAGCRARAASSTSSPTGSRT
jgi:DNA polymerase III alpha subunit